MALVDLEQIPHVALDFANQDHREQARLLNEVQAALVEHRSGGPREPVLERFAALLRHTREHFEREEAAMRRTRFPPFVVHKSEHDRVLEEMATEEARFLDSGDAERLWRYVSAAVPEWFTSHIQTMDFITAQFVSMSETG
jgi:hemerythrin